MATGYTSPLFPLGLKAVTGSVIPPTVGFGSLLFAFGLSALSSGAAISPGDEVQVITTGGIECSVLIDAGTPVRVVISSTKQITVLTEGATQIRVTI